MVRRGSAVQVRQRALQKRRKSALFVRANLHDLQRAMGLEPLWSPQVRTPGWKRSEMDEFASDGWMATSRN
jgi:hypothetical protein